MSLEFQKAFDKQMDEKVTVTKFQGVTRCATEPVGGLKKFPRITSIETIEKTDVSLEGIKQACAKFWAQEGEEVVIMKSDKGVSYHKICESIGHSQSLLRPLLAYMRMDLGKKPSVAISIKLLSTMVI